MRFRRRRSDAAAEPTDADYLGTQANDSLKATITGNEVWGYSVELSDDDDEFPFEHLSAPNIEIARRVASSALRRVRQARRKMAATEVREVIR